MWSGHHAKQGNTPSCLVTAQSKSFSRYIKCNHYHKIPCHSILTGIVHSIGGVALSSPIDIEIWSSLALVIEGFLENQSPVSYWMSSKEITVPLDDENSMYSFVHRVNIGKTCIFGGYFLKEFNKYTEQLNINNNKCVQCRACNCTKKSANEIFDKMHAEQDGEDGGHSVAISSIEIVQNNDEIIAYMVELDDSYDSPNSRVNILAFDRFYSVVKVSGPIPTRGIAAESYNPLNYLSDTRSNILSPTMFHEISFNPILNIFLAEILETAHNLNIRNALKSLTLLSDSDILAFEKQLRSEYYQAMLFRKIWIKMSSNLTMLLYFIEITLIYISKNISQMIENKCILTQDDIYRCDTTANGKTVRSALTFYGYQIYKGYLPTVDKKEHDPFIYLRQKKNYRVIHFQKMQKK
eukprot:128840_1